MNKKLTKKAALKMGWDVATLDEYTNQESQDLFAAATFVGDTLSVIDIQEGVKYKEKLKTIDTDVVWQSGAACGWTPDGSVKLSDREIEVAPIKVNTPFCNLDLIQTWAQRALRAGQIAQLEDMPYQDAVTTHMLARNGEQLERMVWNAEVGNGDYFDGLETVITSVVADTIDLNTAGYTTFDETNAWEVLMSAHKVMNSTEKGRAILEAGAIAFVTPNQFHDYVSNMVTLNKFHFNPDDAADRGELRLFGTRLTVKQFQGRTDDTKFYIANPRNFVFGTDLSEDTLEIKQWYNEDEEEIRFKLRFTAGTQVRFPDEIGYFELGSDLQD
jgi:hypothetical protein